MHVRFSRMPLLLLTTNSGRRKQSGTHRGASAYSQSRTDRTPKTADVFRVLGVRNQFPAELKKRAKTALVRALGQSAPRILRETGLAANSGVHRAFHRRKDHKASSSPSARCLRTSSRNCAKSGSSKCVGGDRCSLESETARKRVSPGQGRLATKTSRRHGRLSEANATMQPRRTANRRTARVWYALRTERSIKSIQRL